VCLAAAVLGAQHFTCIPLTPLQRLTAKSFRALLTFHVPLSPFFFLGYSASGRRFRLSIAVFVGRDTDPHALACRGAPLSRVQVRSRTGLF